MHNTTYKDLVEFGRTLLINKQLDEGLLIITEYLKKLTKAMRCSIFVHDKYDNHLWTILANGIEKLVIPDNEGIVGHVFKTKKELIENAVDTNPHFFKEVDLLSGYQTFNMLACPIYDAHNNTIGVVQLINKLDGFSDDDMSAIRVILRFISTYIEFALIGDKK